jgi:hypothetical protein
MFRMNIYHSFLFQKISFLASQSGNLQQVTYAIQHGADVNTSDVRSFNEFPLSFGITIVNALIKTQADVNLENDFGYNALIYGIIFFNEIKK